MNTLNKTHPHLLNEWYYNKNKTVNPNEIAANSHKKVWWICNKAPDHCWEAIIQNRTKNNTTCPCCCNRKVVKSNCLSTTHPQLCIEWHEDNLIKPEEVTAGSNEKVIWKCSSGKDHVWKNRIVNRAIRNNNCPYCYNKASSTNNIIITHPNHCKEWNYEKNIIKPEEINYGSVKKVWWKCNKKHEWQATPNNKIGKNQSCPYCSGKITDGTNSLIALHPELCKEWDCNKNIISPHSVLPHSHKKIWWKCNKDNSHQWQATPNSRVSLLTSCPHCKSSYGEFAIKNYLEKLNLDYSKEFKFANCKYKKCLPFDFAIHKNNKIIGLIEYQGHQHFFPINYFGGNKTFNEIIIRDEIKRKYCVDNKIPLLEIKYDKIKKVPELIDDFLTIIN